MQTVQMIRETRGIARRILAGVDAERADVIPAGCRNSLRWQAGHILVTQDLLVLGLSGHAVTVPDDWKAWFAKGSSPEAWTSATPGWEELVNRLEPMCEHVCSTLDSIDPDVKLAKPYQTSTGPLLLTVRDAADFSAIHEAVHAGVMMAYKRVLAG